MAISLPRKITLSPMLWIRFLEQPLHTLRIDIVHLLDQSIELCLCGYFCCSIKQIFEQLVRKLLVKVFMKMGHAVSMWITWEYTVYSLEKTFLSIGKKCEFADFEVCW